MKRFQLILFSLILGFSSQAQTVGQFTKNADAFFKKFVQNEKVSYEAIKANPTQLNALVKELEVVDGQDDVGSQVAMAFWINAYNILTINGIVQSYPVNSPMDISNFFDRKINVVGGKKYSLNNIENDVLRKKYKDATIHFALVCGAVSCPPITNFAYSPAKLNFQLKIRTQKALDNEQFLRVDEEKKTIQLSKIFEWYSVDFGGDEMMFSFINKYRSEPLPQNYKISYYEYDWTLNDTKKN